MTMRLNWRWRVFAAVGAMQAWRGYVLIDPASPVSRAVEFRAVWPWFYFLAAVCCLIAAGTRSPRTQVVAGAAVGGAAMLRAVALVSALGWHQAGTAVPDALDLVSVIAGSWGYTGAPLIADVERRT